MSASDFFKVENDQLMQICRRWERQCDARDEIIKDYCGQIWQLREVIASLQTKLYLAGVEKDQLQTTILELKAELGRYAPDGSKI